MSETLVSNDPGVFQFTLDAHCEGCNGQQVFGADCVTFTFIHGELVYVNFYCRTCQQHSWRSADVLRQEMADVSLSAKELVAGCPELRRGVWMVPSVPTSQPELITDCDSTFLESRFS